MSPDPVVTPATPALFTEQQQRVTAATIAADLLKTRTTGLGSQSVPPPHPDDIIYLANWLLGGDPSLYGPEPVARSADCLYNTVVLEITYGSPVTEDTVDALIGANIDAEDVVNVQGTLI